jgi:hypothetical protein
MVKTPPKIKNTSQILKPGEFQRIDKPLINHDTAIIEAGGVDDSDVEELFGTDTQTTETTILKELFNTKNFKAKSELNNNEISIISRIYLLAKITNRPHLREVVDEFIILRISKDRQSRKEFVEANKEMKRDMQGGLLNRMFGGQQ